MRKFLFLFFVLLVSSAATFAAYLVNRPVEVRQPDGTVLNLFATGDEFYHRIHDAQGYTLIRDAQGYVSYAVLQNDKLVSSGVRYGSPIPRDGRIVPNIDISATAKTAKRDEVYKNTPPRPVKKTTSKLRQSGKTDFAPFKPSGPFNSIGDNRGTVNNLVIYISFSNSPAFTASQSSFDDMFNKGGSNVSSVKNYFKAASYNDMNFNSVFYPTQSGSAITATYIDTYPSSYYMPYDATTNTNGYTDAQRTEREHKLLKRAVEYVASSIPAGLNIDMNDDGFVDNVSFITQGGVGPWSSILWAHRWSLYSETASINGKQVSDYMLVPETDMDVSVLCHEMGHVLGAPDLYMYNSPDLNPVGPWDIMSWQSTPPQSTSAHIKNKYWLWTADDEIPEITQSGTYTLNESWIKTNTATQQYNAYKIPSPTSTAGEFFLIEYRNKNTYWDGSLPGNGGLVIYRITPSIGDGNASGPPFEEYVYRADNDLQKATFSSTAGRTTFSDTSNPAAVLQNGSGGLGGITITDIGAPGGSTMSFKVNFPAPVAPVATTATGINYAAFTANWNTVPPASNYKLSIYYKDGTDNVYVLDDFEVGKTTSYIIDDLDRALSTTYYYTVKSVVGGATSTASNEITVPLGSTISNTCNDYTNVQTGESVIVYTWGSGGVDGPVLGNNAYGDSQFADHFNLTSSAQLGSVTIDAGIVQNTSGSGKITVKVWNESSGLPSTVLYSQDVPLSSLSVGNNTITFNSPVTVSSSFFVGYEVHYASTDIFAARNTINRSAGPNTVYVYESTGQWIGTDLYGLNTSMAISVNACLSSPIYAGFTADATSGCDNLTVQFTDASLSTETITSYSWNFGDGTTSTAQNPSHTYNTAGKYTVTLTVTTAGGSKTRTAVDYITVGTTPTVTYTVTEATSANNGEIELTITGSTTYTVAWDDDATVTTKDRTGLAPGTYKVTVTDESGCSSGEITIVVGSSNAITPAMITVTGGPFVYTGSQITPTYTVKDGTTDLVLDTDYEFVSYGANINAGEGSITIKGKGAYSVNEVTKTFPIGKKPITATIATPITKVYDRTKVADLTFGTITGIIAGDAADVSLTISAEYDNENVGTGKEITITEITLEGDKSANYEAPDAASYNVSGDITAAPYTYNHNISPLPKVIIVGSTLDNINAAETGEGVLLDEDIEEVEGNLSWFTDNAFAVPATDAVFDAVNSSLILYYSFETTDPNYDQTPKTGSVTFNVQAGAFQTLQFEQSESTIEVTYGDAPLTNAAVNSSNGGGAITYESDDEDVATVDNDGEVTIVGVGTAVITAKAAMVPALYAETSISYTLEVSAKDINGATVTVVPTYTYNGNAQTPDETDVTVTINTVTLDPATDYTVAASDNTDAGTATVTVTGTGNYTGTATGTFVIGKQSISIDATASTVAQKTYDNTTAANIDVAFTGVASGETLALNFDYTIADAAFNSANVADANQVTATIALVPGGPVAKNYELTGGAFTKAATISKATATGVTQTVMVKTGSANDYEFDLTTLLPSVTGTLGNEAYALGTITNTDGVFGTTLPTISGTTLTLPVQSVAADLTAEVIVTISSDNYENIASTINVVTTDKTPLVISGITMTGGVYNGSPYAYDGDILLTDASDPDFDEEVELDVLYESTDGGTYSDGDAPINAGDYKLTVSVPAANTEYTGSISFNFSITKRPIQIKATDIYAMQNTSLPPAFEYTINNVVAGDVAINPAPAPQPTLSIIAGNIQVIGTYPIVVDLNGATPTDNYTFAIPPTVNGTLHVVSATVPVTGVRLSQNQAVIYEGSTMTLTATVIPENATYRTVTWSSSNSNVASVNNGVVSALSPGTATITVRTDEGGFTATCAVTVLASTPPLSNDATLYSLSVSSGTLNPEFRSYIYEYTVQVPNSVTSIVITGVANNYSAYVSGDGEKLLQTGNNSFIITVVAEDGSILNYTVTVKRDVGTSTDAASSEQPTVGFDEAFTVMQIRSGSIVRTAQVFDLSGMLQIEARPNASGTIYVPIAHLSSTAYIVRIETASGTTTTRFVKRK